MLAEGKRGLFPIAAGSQNFAGLDQYSGVNVSENLPRYMSQTYAGNMFHFSSGSITATSTVTVSPLPAGTATPPLALWNPVGSGKNLVIVKVGATSLSGTPGGPLVWNYANFTTLTTASTSTPVSGIMGQAAASVAKVYSGSAAVTTGSLVGIYYKLAVPQSTMLITTSTGGSNGVQMPMYEDVGGDIIIPPGTWGALANFATGTSHVFQVGVSWIETPI